MSDHPATGYTFLDSQPALDPVIHDLVPADFAVELISKFFGQIIKHSTKSHCLTLIHYRWQGLYRLQWLEFRLYQSWQPVASNFTVFTYWSPDYKPGLSLHDLRFVGIVQFWCSGKINTTTVTYNVKSEANDLVDNQAESPDLIFRNGIWCMLCHFRYK